MTKTTKLRELDSKIDLFRMRIKDADDFKVKDDVFDTRTLLNLYALAKKEIIVALGGPVSTGKEANIFYATGSEGGLAIKIYRISTSNFKAMQNYLLGDPRFGSIKGTKRAIVSAWTRKEFRNLSRAIESGVRVPRPVAMRENILVMEFIGEEEVPAPQLRDVDLSYEEAKIAFDDIAGYITLLYNKADLVHGDLSEFNILYTESPVLIDMGQSVTLDHPMAETFLERDINNIARYFKKKYDIGSPEAIWERVRQFAHQNSG
jgi:RIO kinase 1